MLHRIIVIFISLCLLPFPKVSAQELVLPAPGTMVQVSPAFVPPLLRGIKVNPSDPFQMEFILDRGGHPASRDINEESRKLVKYFLAGLTIPEKDLWVNLSPYEKDRIVPESFGQTEMGRDLLAQDYLLKQLTASLVYPESEIGQEFWKRIYQSVSNKNVPVNTFNKVWILPDKAVIYENAQNGTVYIVESRLKVLTEKDYLAARKNSSLESNDQAVRNIVIPALTKEVNEGANFSQLRQVYNSLILAVWYKNKIKNSILSHVYADKNKVSGVVIDDPLEKQRIYERYLQAFKKGAYSFIREEHDPLTERMVPRKYFSGGVTLLNVSQAMIAITQMPKQAASLEQLSIRLEDMPFPKRDIPKDAAIISLKASQKQSLREVMDHVQQQLNQQIEPNVPKEFWFKQHVIYPFDDVRGGIGTFILLRKIIHAFDESFTEDEPLTEEVAVKIANKLSDLGLINRGELKLLTDAIKGEDGLQGLLPMYAELLQHNRLIPDDQTERKAFGVKVPKELMLKLFDGAFGGFNKPGDERLAMAQEEMIRSKKDHYILDYYKRTSGIFAVFQNILENLNDLLEDSGDYLESLSGIAEGFVLVKQMDGTFRIKSDLGDDKLVEVFVDDPQLILKVFQQSLSSQAPISGRILSAIKLAADEIELNPQNRDDMKTQIADRFVEILSAKGDVSLILMQMQEAGVLKWVLPSLAGLDDHFAASFHRFTLTAHTIYLLYVFDHFDAVAAKATGKSKAYFDGLKEMIRQYKDSDNSHHRLTLRLGMLLHDAQKETGYVKFDQPHPFGGADVLVPQVFSILKSAVAVRPMVGWLVWYHQELTTRAESVPSGEYYYSDLIDLLRLGDRKLDKDLWNLFYILTVADGLSVDPSVKKTFLDKDPFPAINAMHRQMTEYFSKSSEEQRSLRDVWEKKASYELQLYQDKLRSDDLYKAVLNTAAEIVLPMQREAFSEYVKSHFEESYAEYIQMFPMLYLRQLPMHVLGQQLIRFMHVQWERQQASTDLQGRVFQSLVGQVRTGFGTLIDVMVLRSMEKQGDMHKVMGILSALGINIFDAQVHISSEGIVVNRIQGYFLTHEKMLAREIWDNVTSKSPELKSMYRDKRTDDWEDLLPTIIDAVLKGYLDIEELFKAGPVHVLSQLRKNATEPVSVTFSERQKVGNFHVSPLNITAPDRNGLAYLVMRLLNERFGVNVESSPLETLQAGVLDRFFLTKNDSSGAKRALNDEEKEEITAYLKVLLGMKDIPAAAIKQMAGINPDSRNAKDLLVWLLPFSPRESQIAEGYLRKMLSGEVVEGIALENLMNYSALRDFYDLVKSSADEAMITIVDGSLLRQPSTSLPYTIKMLEAKLLPGDVYEARWGMRRVIVRGLAAMGQVMRNKEPAFALDFLKARIMSGAPNEEKNDDVKAEIEQQVRNFNDGSLQIDRTAIVDALKLLYPTQDDDHLRGILGQLVDLNRNDAKHHMQIFSLLNKWSFEMVLRNPYILYSIFNLAPQEIDALVASIERMRSNMGNSEDASAYIQLALMLEMVLPKKGMKYVESMMQNNGGIGSVARFLDAKKALLLSVKVWPNIKILLDQMRDRHADRSRKVFSLDLTAFFKLMDISSSFVQLNKESELISALSGLDPEKDIFQVSSELEKVFLKELGNFINVGSEVDPDAQKKLYMPYVPRILEAVRYVQRDKPWKAERFKAFLRAMLEDRFWDFIENVDQNDPVGQRNALHNQHLRELMSSKGINVTRWLAKGNLDRFQSGTFDFQKKAFVISPIMRVPGHDLFLGDFTSCSVGMSSNLEPDGMMDRLVDEGINVIEVRDRRNDKTIAVAWLYVVDDGSVVIQNFEIHGDYEVPLELKGHIGDQMLAYAEKYSAYIGAKRLLFGMPAHGKFVGKDSFIEKQFGDRRVPFNMEKIGGYIGEKYYLSSAGKAEAYLIKDRLQDNAMASASQAFHNSINELADIYQDISDVMSIINKDPKNPIAGRMIAALISKIKSLPPQVHDRTEEGDISDKYLQDLDGAKANERAREKEFQDAKSIKNPKIRFDALTRLNERLIEANQMIMKLRAIIAYKFLKQKSPNISAALAALVGAKNANSKLQAAVLFRLNRERSIKWQKMPVDDVSLYGIRYERTNGRIDLSKKVTIKEDQWVVLHPQLRSLRTDLNTGRFVQARKKIAMLLNAYNPSREKANQAFVQIHQRLKNLESDLGLLVRSEPLTGNEKAGLKQDIDDMISVLPNQIVKVDAYKKYDIKTALRHFVHSFDSMFDDERSTQMQRDMIENVRDQLGMSKDLNVDIQPLTDALEWLKKGKVSQKTAARKRLEKAIVYLQGEVDVQTSQKVKEELRLAGLELTKRLDELKGIYNARMLSYQILFTIYNAETGGDFDSIWDKAMAVSNTGGIDLTTDKMKLEAQGTGKMLDFSVDPQMLKRFENTPGFTPVIINIQPLTNLAAFLNA